MPDGAHDVVERHPTPPLPPTAHAAAEPEGLEPPPAVWFEPLSVETATWALAGIALGGIVLAAVIFSRREYRDLT